MRQLIALAERIATDHAYRDELEAAPIAAFAAAGVPLASAEPLLHALPRPDEVLRSFPKWWRTRISSCRSTRDC
jgi:hypothetical protein